MIEDSAVMLILLLVGIPSIIGIIGAILTRPDKHYYKISGGRVLRKKR